MLVRVVLGQIVGLSLCSALPDGLLVGGTSTSSTSSTLEHHDNHQGEATPNTHLRVRLPPQLPSWDRQEELRRELSHWEEIDDYHSQSPGDEGDSLDDYDVSLEMLLTFQRPISSQQYCQEGMLIWEHGTLVFVSTTWSSSSFGTSPPYFEDFDNETNTFHNQSSYDDRNFEYDGDRPDEYYGYEDEEIDCSRFLDWDDPPPECREQPWMDDENDDPFAGAASDATVSPTGFSADDMVVDNLVRIRFMIGMAQPPPTNLEYIADVISMVVNQMLHSVTPFDSYYFGDSMQLQDLPRLLEEDVKDQLDVRRRLTYDEEEGENEWGHEGGGHDGRHGSSSLRAVHLLHAWTTMLEHYPSPPDPNVVWYVTRVDYAAFFRPAPGEATVPMPIRRPEYLGNITWLCQSRVDRYIGNGLLVSYIDQSIQEMLQHEEERQQQLIILEDSGEANTTTISNSSRLESMRANMDFLCAAPIDKDGRRGKPYWVSDWNGHRPRIVGSKPLTLEFGLREWIGASVGGSTMLLATLLFWISCAYQKRRMRKQWETAMLTEQGISDVLRVGWRYQAATVDESKKGQQSHQLFIQIYEKPKFRGENDSMLHGGVEQEEMGLAGACLPVLPSVSGPSTGSNTPTLTVSASQSNSLEQTGGRQR